MVGPYLNSVSLLKAGEEISLVLDVVELKLPFPVRNLEHRVSFILVLAVRSLDVDSGWSK